MSAGEWNIKCDQSATFTRQILWKDDEDLPINLTGGSAKMQVRTQSHFPGQVALELSTDNGRITLGGSAGTITLIVDAEDMGSLNGSYVYDLYVYLPSGTTRLVYGTFDVSSEVTK